ncbi:MAG: Gfo/Idh/MocA family oxidoreductase [Acutalibacteraceae bacterium]|nr:Gfo/Idh/MocA family oxidoreductase [Acutalibacteraceae bacterium]
MSDAVLNQFTQAVEEAAAETGRRFKVGIIGTGWIAEAHLESYLEMDDVDIVAMADLIPGKAEKFAKKYNKDGRLDNVRFYPSHKELLDAETELDAVSVCTYNMTHAECSIYALKKGVNVLLEKPMCVTTEEAVEIMKAEKESGKIISIGFQPRGDENMKMVRKIVQSGELGEIYYIQTGGGRRRGVPNSTFIEKKTAGIGAMGDIGCYSLDVVLNAIDYPKPLTVTGYTSGFFGSNPKYNTPEDAARFNVEDFAAAFVRLEGGIILDFRISWAMHPDTPGDTIIFGKEGALRIPSTACWNGSMSGPMTIYHDVAGEQVETIVPLIENKGKGLFYKKCRSFLEAIANGDPAPIPTSQILYNQAIIDHIVKSAELGREVEVVIPEI